MRGQGQEPFALRLQNQQRGKIGMSGTLRRGRVWPIGLVAIVIVLLLGVAAVFWWAALREPDRGVEALGNEQPQGGPADSRHGSAFAKARQEMVDEQLRARDINDARVLEAMGRVPRHKFVPENLQDEAYQDSPLPIGEGQTISQPYIVALMTQLAEPKPGCRALDVGTGSGYQAAVLAELCKEVYSIEILEPLAVDARRRLQRLGYENVTVRSGDGYRGWPGKAPFDVIIVAAAPDHVPKLLVEQLAPGGRLVIPVGDFFQELLLIEKQEDGSVAQESVAPVRFVPMTGDAQKRQE